MSSIGRKGCVFYFKLQFIGFILQFYSFILIYKIKIDILKFTKIFKSAHQKTPLRTKRQKEAGGRPVGPSRGSTVLLPMSPGHCQVGGRPEGARQEAAQPKRPVQKRVQGSAAQRRIRCVLQFIPRSSAQEFTALASQLTVDYSAKESPASVEQNLCHVFMRNERVLRKWSLLTEHPSWGPFTLLEKVLDEFSKQVHMTDWTVGSPDTIQYKYTSLDSHLSRHQNPREADSITKVQAELDETKIIQHHGVFIRVRREAR